MSDQYMYGQVCSRWAGLAVSLDLHHLVPALAPTESRHGYRDHHHTFPDTQSIRHINSYLSVTIYLNWSL